MNKLLPLALAFIVGLGSHASAQTRVLQLIYTPTKRAQVAVWIEAADGTFLRTVMLTEAVGLRGIGNRPGALQMNSGFRWPYGRREGVLPVWAYRRASAPGAQAFPRVIFQNRVEGLASRTTNDQSPDPYYCLSFQNALNSNVDAVTCASAFNSDKGRFITATDVQHGYAEPYEMVIGTTMQRPLSLTSLYPMRRDIMGGVGNDVPDTTMFASTTRTVMPDIDAVTRATAAADTPQLLTFNVPDDWPEGDYVVQVEINTERDLNAFWTEAAHPTPHVDNTNWDSWSSYGYAYRGQPSVVFAVPIHLDMIGGTWSTDDAAGYGNVEGLTGDLTPIDATITNDATNSPGSGIDRLGRACGSRLAVSTTGFAECTDLPQVPLVTNLLAAPVTDKKHSHEWGTVSFDAIGIASNVGTDAASGYQIKISTRPITTDTEFLQAEDAKAASSEIEGINLCPLTGTGFSGCSVNGGPTCPAPGTTVRFDLGRLNFLTHYYVAIRAVGKCGSLGPIATTEFNTTAINFTTIAPCFIATAAHGSPMADDVRSLRAFRDEALMPSRAGRAFVHAYYELGPSAAHVIESSYALRAIARAVLRPLVQASDALHAR